MTLLNETESIDLLLDEVVRLYDVGELPTATLRTMIEDVYSHEDGITTREWLNAIKFNVYNMIFPFA